MATSPDINRMNIMGQSKTATMKDVAKEAGVSIGTVDRVLHNRGRFSEATAQRVREAATRLEFQPNIVASNLKKAQWTTLVAVLPHLEQDGGFWATVAAGIERAVQELAHHYVRIRFAHYDRFRPESFDAIAREITGALTRPAEPPAGAEIGESGDAATTDENYSGVILAPTLQSASADLARRVAPLPVVVLDGELPEVELLCSISQESYEGGLLAAKLLYTKGGNGRYASIVVGRDDYHLLRRRAGFEAFFQEIVETERLEADSEAGIREVVRARMEEEPGLDGIFVTNAAAHAVIDSIRGLRMSQGGTPDLPPIVGYDLLPENVFCLREGSLSFLINQQPENQGYQAVYALYRHSVLSEQVEPQIRIPVDLVTRETLQFHQVPPYPPKG